MFERFTEKAVKVIMLAQEEARRLGHNFVGSGQILCGLMGEGTGIAAKTLKEHGFNLGDMRRETEALIGRGSGFVSVEIPFTHNGKELINLAWSEAKAIGHNYIGTEHLLLAILAHAQPNEQGQTSTAAEILIRSAVTCKTLRSTVYRLLGECGHTPALSTNRLSKEMLPELDQLVLNLQARDLADRAAATVEKHLVSTRTTIDRSTARPAAIAKILEALAQDEQEREAEKSELLEQLANLPRLEKEAAEKHAELCKTLITLTALKAGMCSDDAIAEIEQKITVSRNKIQDIFFAPRKLKEQLEVLPIRKQKDDEYAAELKQELDDVPGYLTALRELEAELQQRLTRLKAESPAATDQQEG